MTFTPVPKPVPALPKRKLHGSTLAAPTKPIGNNPKRQAESFAFAYESDARVEWIKGLGCVFCGKRPSDNAHIRGGGAGKKAAARFIVPACRTHHNAMHQHGTADLESTYSIDLEATADRIQREWEALNG